MIAYAPGETKKLTSTTSLCIGMVWLGLDGDCGFEMSCRDRWQQCETR